MCRNKGLLRLGVSRKSWGRFSYESEKVPEEVNTTRGKGGVLYTEASSSRQPQRVGSYEAVSEIGFRFGIFETFGS